MEKTMNLERIFENVLREAQTGFKLKCGPGCTYMSDIGPVLLTGLNRSGDEKYYSVFDGEEEFLVPEEELIENGEYDGPNAPTWREYLLYTGDYDDEADVDSWMNKNKDRSYRAGLQKEISRRKNL
jgi:hypothetical protein